MRPEGSPPPPPEFKEYVERSFRESVKPMSEQLGLTMNLPTRHPNTRLTHEAVAFAVDADSADDAADAGDGGELGAGGERSEAFITGVFEAYWERDEDIGDTDVLCALAENVGLDAAAMRSALEGRQFALYVNEKLQLAKNFGISAVPSLIIDNKFLVRGLPSEEHLLKAIREAKGA